MPKKPRLESAQRRITIAFDGACLGNPGPGGYGAILIHEPTGLRRSCGAVIPNRPTTGWN